MFDFFDRIVEERILKAQEEGKFDELPGRGRPIRFEHDSMVPEEVRLAYKILKDADFLPPELELRKEILRIQGLIRGVADNDERLRLIRDVNRRILELNMRRRTPLAAETAQIYAEDVRKGLGDAG